jgi:thiosulfate/3-mercaptopyruvate sulfurtransferase
VNAESPAAPPTRLDIRFQVKRVAERADVQAAIDKEGTQLIDARSEAEYRGETKPSDGGPAGHIPSARSLDGYDLVDADGRFLEAEAQRATLAKVGLAAERPVVVYSQGGGRSALVVFALERLGFHARHYFHGLADWTKSPAAPLIGGAESIERRR